MACMASILREFRVRNQKRENSGERCCIVGCSNRRGTDEVRKISYHAFPKELKRWKLWVKAIPRAEWTPRRFDRVCGDHFVGGKFTFSSVWSPF